jgi:SAM-dependent methyltransferase
MGFYEDWVVPWVIGWPLTVRGVAEQRRIALAPVRGSVLEIGFGFGASVPFYPRGVHELTALEPSAGMLRRAEKSIASPPFPVNLLRASAEEMPLGDGSFDAVVSNWTLCTISDPARALREVQRVLKPGGRFLFVEHGLASDPRVARWQTRLTPLHRLLTGGCCLDLPVATLLEESGLVVERLDRYRGKPGPKILTQMYRGVARPPSATTRSEVR